jgi:DHA1 family bicyclomycin/chloramphenicol resistance-like MFS transporter
VARVGNPPVGGKLIATAAMDAQADAKSNELRTTAAHPWRLLPLLMAMTAIGPLTLNILVPAMPGLAVTLQTDVAAVQLTLSLFLVGIAVSQLLLGPLSDRFGRRPVVLFGLALTAISSVGAIIVSTVGGLILARTIQALGASAGLVIGRAMVRDLYDRERAAAMIGWVMTVMVVAPMLSPMIGGLLDTIFDWRAIFIFIACVSFAVLIWAILKLPETRPDHITGGGIVQMASDMRSLLVSRSFNGFMLCAALGTAPFFTFLGGAPHVVVSIMGRSSAEYGFWFVSSALGYMLGNLAAAQLSPRFGVHAMILAGIIISIVGAAITTVLSLVIPEGGPAIVFLPQFLISFGNGVLLPNAIAGAVSVRPQSAGAASGITGFTQMGLGAIAAQASSHVLADAASPLPMALMMLAFCIVVLVAYLGLLRHGDGAM